MVPTQLLDTINVGEIALGAAADFMVVTGDPLRDIRVLQQPAFVVKAGRLVN